MTITQISYQISDLTAAEAFYRDVLGFETIRAPSRLTCQARHGAELRFQQADVAQHAPDPQGRYWKICLTMPDLDRAAAHLRRIGWPVSAPRQFRDIGYMCHLADPSGLSIELLPHGFEGAARPGPDGHDIGAQATLAHLTLRSSSRAAADAEWVTGAGMKLMSVQPVPSHGFALYFYAKTDDTPPQPALEHVGNREWLWRRRYTLVEVQVFDDRRAIAANDPAMAGMISAS